MPSSRRLLGPTIVLALVLPLAGCLGEPAARDGAGPAAPTAAAPKDPADATATDRTLAIRGCTGYSVQAPVPWDAVADALPDGFEPASWWTAPDGQAAQVFIDGWTCSRSRVRDRPTGEVSLLFAKVEVVPPADLAPADGARSYIPLFAAADAAPVASELSRWGVAADGGSPTIAGSGAGPVRTGGVQGEAGNVSVRTRVAMARTAPTTPTFEGDTSRYFVVDPPLFHGDASTVTGIVDRRTNSTVGTFGEGQFAWTGDGPAEALQPAGPGLGFETVEPTWGETFRWRPHP